MNSMKKLDGNYVKSYYDGFLSGYDKEYSYYRWQAGPVEKIHYSQTKRALVPFLKTLKGNVLEIGGGDAIWTMEYISGIQNLTFLDISQEMISRAQKRLEKFSQKISYVNDDFLINDLSNKKFDHVVSIRNLEYFVDKESVISKIYNQLNGNGTFVLVTKSPKYHLRDSAKQKTLHTSQIQISDLLQLMRSKGFTIKSVRPAIIGKLFRFFPMRLLSHLLHFVTLIIPWKILPIKLLGYISESFVIYAKK